MSQKSKVVDITQSYVPVDPQSFPETLGLTAKEDDPLKDMTILAYEGYNFLPTSYGYRSYFGTDTLLSFDALSKPCDKLLSFQSKTYENALIAFCSDGIYQVKAGNTAWTKIWALTDTWLGSGVYSQYTWTVIENTLYIYRQGASNVLKINDDLTNALITPSFLNMAGQMGIFKGNGSLCFWDSENSIAWSNVFDLTDFTPSIENLVGNTVFLGVLGRIVHIQDHGEGFVIYATKSIVGVTYSGTSTMVWDAGVVTSESGIAHPGAMTVGTTNQEHFVYTSTGIMKIGHYNALSRKFDSAIILPELYDFLRESRDPVYLSCYAARFLYFSLVDASYINGRTSFMDVTIPSLQAPVITVNQSLIDSTYAEGFPLSGKKAFQLMDSFLRDPNGTLVPDYTAGTFPVPKWVAASTGANSSVAIDAKGYTSAVYDIDGVAVVWSEGGSISKSPIVPWTLESFYLSYKSAILASTGLLNVESFDSRLSSTKTRVNPPYPVKRFIQTGLYPGKDTAVDPTNPNKLSAWDTIYNFLACMDEEAEIYESARSQAMTEAAQINGTSFTWEYMSATAPTITNYRPYPSTSYIPHKGYSVDINLVKQAGISTAAYLEVIASYNKYTKISWEGSVRSHIIQNLTETDFPDHILTFDFIGATYKLVHWGSLNSVDDLVSLLIGKTLKASGKPDLLINTFVLEPFQNANPLHTIGRINGIPSNFSMKTLRNVIGSSGVYESYQYDDPIMVTGQETLIAALLNNHRIYNGDSLPTAHASLDLFVPSAASPGSFSLSYNSADHTASYTLDPLYPYVGLSNGIPLHFHNAFAPISYSTTFATNVTMQGDMTLGLENTSEFFEIYSVLVPATFKPLTDIGQSPTWEHTYGSATTRSTTFCKQLRILEYLTKEEVHAGSVDSYRVIVTQNMVVTAIENVLYDPLIAGMTKVTHALRLTNYGVDTYNKASESYTSLSTIFTPLPMENWIVDPEDPGNNIFVMTYDATPIGYVDYYAPSANLLSARHNQNCSYWKLYYNSDATKVLPIADFMKHSEGTMLGVAMPLGPIPVTEPVSCMAVGEDLWEVASSSDFVFPGAVYTLQNGSPIPGYATKQGALVFDLHLKRWGKYKGMHKALVEYSPINAVQNAVIPYTNFGMDAGILASDGKIKVFSAITSDSYIRYGKIGYYRFGVSRLMEIRLHFRTKSTGHITIDASLEGRNLDTYLQASEDFTDTLEHIMYIDINAKWFTISIHGQYDLQYVEFRGNMTSRR